MWEWIRRSALLILIFAFGFVVGVMTLLHRQSLPLPSPVWGEFREFKPPLFFGHHPNFRQMAHMMDSLRPAMEAYRTKVDSVQDSFHPKFEALLRPDQLEKFQTLKHERDSLFGHVKREMQNFHWGEHPRSLLPHHPGSLEGMMMTMAYKPFLKRLTVDLNLDQSQQVQTEALLKARRQAVLNLLDSLPPPSLLPLLEKGEPLEGAKNQP